MDREIIGKVVIIINGHGGTGKDTLCGFAGKNYRTVNVSSAEPIKEIARRYGGWQGEKDEKSRKFLADLKQLFAAYNDLPLRYLVEEYKKFSESGAEILFVHIREGEEIDKFKRQVELPCVTLLVRRNSVRQQWGNASDDNVENYDYDYCYDNDKELSEAEEDFRHFLAGIMKGGLRSVKAGRIDCLRERAKENRGRIQKDGKKSKQQYRKYL